ncbi:MAG: GAF domain-containing protein, partial [Saonia sp.]
MENYYKGELPLKSLISFNKLLEQYDVMAKSEDKFLAAKAKRILDAQSPYPELREGFSDISLLEKHADVIKIILQDTFSDVLSENEIKAASLPYENTIFNSSRRFQRILKDAGPDFTPTIRNQEDGVNYIMACTVILSFYYGFKLDFRRPYFYDIPDANGVMHYYRILYNADFMEIMATDKAKEITQEDVDELLESSENLDLWMEKIPPNSFISKGFVISNMFDVTAEHSISEIKSSLIESNKRGSDNFMDHLHETFKSLFNLPNIQVGFVTYNPKDNQFEKVYGKGVESFILQGKDTEICNEALCQGSYGKLLRDNTYFAISNVEKYMKLSGGVSLYKSLNKQGIKSAIFAPIADDGELLGVLELVSTTANELNSVNATKLEDVMPYIVSAVLRSKAEEENLIDAIIQNECTSV